MCSAITDRTTAVIDSTSRGMTSGAAMLTRFLRSRGASGGCPSAGESVNDGQAWSWSRSCREDQLDPVPPRVGGEEAHHRGLHLVVVLHRVSRRFEPRREGFEALAIGEPDRRVRLLRRAEGLLDADVDLL